MLEGINAHLGERIRGHRFVLALDVAAATTPLVEYLRESGADGVLVVAAVDGAGDAPDADVVYVERGAHEATAMAGLRHYLRCIEQPSARVSAAVDAFDPDGSALVVVPPFATAQQAFGRDIHGARRPEWSALEDKMIVDELWDAAGVRRAPVDLVRVGDAVEAASRLDRGRGTVWVADNRLGWHGGGGYTKWVPLDDAQRMVEWFEPRAHRIRVMPFLEGIPCSIHGFVTPSGTAAFRPVEMVILRHAEHPEFVYAGMSTFWDPPAADRSEMRAAARNVGRILHERVDYRGPFSIDGVLTADGFMPTELNPRQSAGYAMQASAVEGLRSWTLTRAFADGDIDVDPAWLEDLVVTAADRDRKGGMGVPLPGTIDRADEVSIRFTETDVVVDDETPDATLSVGASVNGSFVRMVLDPERHEVGTSAAPRAAMATAFASDRWNLGAPPVVPAPDVRSPSG